MAGPRKNLRMILVCSGVVVLILTGTYLFLPKERSLPAMEFRVTSSLPGAPPEERMSMVVRSVRQDGGMVVDVLTGYAAIADWRARSRPTTPGSDETVAVMELSAGYKTYGMPRWVILGGLIRRLSYKDAGRWMKTVGYTELSKADTLYLRRTSRGTCYVSTAEDREHAVPDDFFRAAGTDVTAACRDHWAEWLSQVDSLIERSLPPR